MQFTGIFHKTSEQMSYDLNEEISRRMGVLPFSQEKQHGACRFFQDRIQYNTYETI